jgi:hypothetical protein
MPGASQQTDPNTKPARKQRPIPAKFSSGKIIFNLCRANLTLTGIGRMKTLETT